MLQTGTKFSAPNSTVGIIDTFDKQDIPNNKAMTILAYFNLLVLIPLLAAKESKFTSFHTNQGPYTGLAILKIACGTVYSLLSSVIPVNFQWFPAGIIDLALLVWIGKALIYLVFSSTVIGIVNAANGETNNLPIIGKCKILKQKRKKIREPCCGRAEEVLSCTDRRTAESSPQSAVKQ